MTKPKKKPRVDLRPILCLPRARAVKEDMYASRQLQEALERKRRIAPVLRELGPEPIDVELKL